MKCHMFDDKECSLITTTHTHTNTHTKRVIFSIYYFSDFTKYCDIGTLFDQLQTFLYMIYSVQTYIKKKQKKTCMSHSLYARRPKVVL